MNDLEWKLTIKPGRKKGYNPDQPRVPAGQTGGGRWASSGGFVSGTQDAPDGLYDRYEVDKPSDDEKRRFLEHIDRDIHEDVKALWPEDGRLPILAKARDQWTAYHKGLWVVVPQEVDGPSATHEFLHHLVAERFGREWPGRGDINKYNPRTLFNHANNAFTGSKKNEDLTMMLGFYDRNKAKWAQNITDSGAMWNNPGPAVIAAKVEEASRFLEEVTG